MNARCLFALCVGMLSLAVLTPLTRSAPLPEAKKTRSPFAGSWSGTYTFLSPAGEQEGESKMTVDDEGNIKGEAFNKTIGQNATFKGTVDKDGRESIEISFPGQTYTADGTVAKTSKGTVIGTLVQKSGGTFMGMIEFEKKPIKAK